MRVNAKQLNKLVNYIFFMAAFFIQAYVDGKYIAYGEEPIKLKVIKYLLVGGGILFGVLQLSGRKRFVFLKELRNVLFSIGMFLVVSLLLILARGGDLSFCLELIMRYAMSILYAFVLINVLDFQDVYNLMVYFLAISIFGWVLQKGDSFLDVSQYAKISFERSYSPFESHYFAPSAMNCCAFFLYYKKNKWTQMVSFLFALMTFKRVQIIFAIALLLMPLLIDPNKQVKKKTFGVFCVSIVLMTLVYYSLLQPEYEWILETITGQPAASFTSGRSVLLQDLIDSGYRMGGLGTSEVVLGRGIEMELISIMLEMSFPVMVIFVCCYSSVAGRKMYSLLVMAYLMVLLMTSSGLYNVFMWTTAFLFFGCVNHIRTEEFHPWKRRRIRINFSN